MMITKLSKKSTELIKDFGEWAMAHGLEQDQGYGKSVTRAEDNFNYSLAKLQKHVLGLENKIHELLRTQFSIKVERPDNKGSKKIIKKIKVKGKR